MGRIIRRVPVNFHLSHPIGETWPGYLNPYYAHCEKCATCEGSGYSPDAARFNREWYGSIYDDVDFDPRSTGSKPFENTHAQIIALAERNTGLEVQTFERDGHIITSYPGRLMREMCRLADHFNRSWSHHLSQADVDALVTAGRLMEFTRRPRNADQAAQLAAQVTPQNPHPYWLDSPNGYVPTAAEVNEWSLSGLAHDSINAWVCIKARCERLALSATCPDCDGSGEIWPDYAHSVSLHPDPDPAVYLSSQTAADAWTEIDPPSGPAYQLWETVSEGSPISPAFETPGALAAHLATFDVWGSADTDYATWLRFILDPGWAPSGVSTPETGFVSGVEYFGRETSDIREE